MMTKQLVSMKAAIVDVVSLMATTAKNIALRGFFHESAESVGLANLHSLSRFVPVVELKVLPSTTCFAFQTCAPRSQEASNAAVYGPTVRQLLRSVCRILSVAFFASTRFSRVVSLLKFRVFFSGAVPRTAAAAIEFRVSSPFTAGIFTVANSLTLQVAHWGAL